MRVRSDARVPLKPHNTRIEHRLPLSANPSPILWSPGSSDPAPVSFYRRYHRREGESFHEIRDHRCVDSYRNGNWLYSLDTEQVTARRPSKKTRGRVPQAVKTARCQ